MVYLTCINVGPLYKRDYATGENILSHADGLIRGNQYTSPGLCLDDDGVLCYWINELDKELLVERFRVNDKPTTPSIHGIRKLA